MKNSPPDSQLHDEIIRFRNSCKTLTLATVNADSTPALGVAPFVIAEDDAICVFISELAQHTRNLLAGSAASLLLAADEQDSRNLFARQRLALQVKAHEILHSTAAWHSTMDIFTQRFDATVEILKTLPDFHLFCFSIEQGTYVQGFGKAFEISGPQLQPA